MAAWENGKVIQSHGRQILLQQEFTGCLVWGSADMVIWAKRWVVEMVWNCIFHQSVELVWHPRRESLQWLRWALPPIQRTPVPEILTHSITAPETFLSCRFQFLISFTSCRHLRHSISRLSLGSVFQSTISILHMDWWNPGFQVL